MFQFHRSRAACDQTIGAEKNNRPGQKLAFAAPPALSTPPARRLKPQELLASGFHELLGAQRGDEIATIGLALRMAGHAMRGTGKGLCICSLTNDVQEFGRLYGHGFKDLGIQPDRIVMVTAAREKELLWVLEEAIGSDAFAAVIGIMGGQERLYGFAQSRRLKLRSLATDTSLFMIRHWRSEGATAAHGRWRVTTRPSLSPGEHANCRFLGSPRIQLRLERMASMRPQTWEMEFDAAHNLHMAPLLEHGPAGKADGRRRSAA